MSSISSFDIISTVLLSDKVEGEGRWPDTKIFLCVCIPATAPDAAAVNPKEIKKI